MKEDQQGNFTHEKEEISEETDDSESEPWYYKPVAGTKRACGKPLAGGTRNLELLLRTVISAKKLSIYGATADLFDEVPKGIRAPEKPAALEHLEQVEIPTVLSDAENSTNEQQWRNLRQEYERNFEQLSKDQKLPKLCSDAGCLSNEDKASILLKQKENRCNIDAEKTRCFAMKREPV